MTIPDFETWAAEMRAIGLEDPEIERLWTHAMFMQGGLEMLTRPGYVPAKRGKLTTVDDALVFLLEIRDAMRTVPVKQHDRTAEEQRNVEKFTTAYCWLGDVLAAHGCSPETF